MNPKIDERIKEEYEAKIKGKFKIYLGNKLYAKGKNKWTRYFVSTLVQHVYNPDCEYRRYYTGMFAHTGFLPSGAQWYGDFRVGKDTTTPTNPSMEDLVDKIDIPPDTKNVVLFKEISYSKYTCKYKGLWNPGNIPPQTIGELGVYMLLSDDSWESPQENTKLYTLFETATYKSITFSQNAGKRLAMRISSADGAFDPIDYTSEDALILEWYVTIKF